jgi:hypothetical protein
MGSSSSLHRQSNTKESLRDTVKGAYIKQQVQAINGSIYVFWLKRKDTGCYNSCQEDYKLITIAPFIHVYLFTGP